jgi:hypothetical protein
MFTQISPQKVRHLSGFIVQVIDRQTVEYLEEKRSAFIEIDFAATTGIFEKTLSNWKTGNDLVPMGEMEKQTVLNRIVAGLHAMGLEKVEIC